MCGRGRSSRGGGANTALIGGEISHVHFTLLAWTFWPISSSEFPPAAGEREESRRRERFSVLHLEEETATQTDRHLNRPPFFPPFFPL